MAGEERTVANNQRASVLLGKRGERRVDFEFAGNLSDLAVQANGVNSPF